jgi:DNA-binding CsgD family transcriptional regulator
MADKRIILPENHISLTSSIDIDDILKPLKRIGILYFTYMRNYLDCTQLYLSNQSEWVRAYYDLKLYETSQFQHGPDSYQSGKVVWPIQSDLPVYQYARENLKSDHGITIIKKSEKYTEFYFFSSSLDNYNILNVYLNNLDMLDRFVLFFNDRAERLLKKAEKTKIILPGQLYQQNEEKIHTNPSLADMIDGVINEMQIKKYRIKHEKYRNVKLSSRELDCIFLYQEGKTAKETARELNISQRTVETYFENIKNKLSCYSKDQVMQFLLKDGFF